MPQNQSPLNPVSRFHAEVDMVVRRVSKSESLSPMIDEVTEHFRDIYEEERVSHSEVDAENFARKRIGSTTTIALQILSTPSRIERGLLIQKLTVIVPILSAIVYCAHAFSYASPVFEFIQKYLTQPVLYLYAFAGLAFGYGVMMAKKVAWKPLLGATAFLFMAGVPSLNYLLKSELLFGMEKSEAKLIVAQQAAIAPKVDQVESAIKMIYSRGMLSAKAPDQAISHLNQVIQANPTGFYEVDGKHVGRYLYPQGIEFRSDRIYSYLVTLGQTDDLALAKMKWQSSSEINQQIPLAMKTREQNIQAYLGFLDTKPVPWTYGLAISGGLTVMCTLPFLGFAIVGFFAGRIQVLRGDWFRLTRQS